MLGSWGFRGLGSWFCRGLSGLLGVLGLWGFTVYVFGFGLGDKVPSFSLFLGLGFRV